MNDTAPRGWRRTPDELDSRRSPVKMGRGRGPRCKVCGGYTYLTVRPDDGHIVLCLGCTSWLDIGVDPQQMRRLIGDARLLTQVLADLREQGQDRRVTWSALVEEIADATGAPKLAPVLALAALALDGGMVEAA